MKKIILFLTTMLIFGSCSHSISKINEHNCRRVILSSADNRSYFVTNEIDLSYKMVGIATHQIIHSFCRGVFFELLSKLEKCDTVPQFKWDHPHDVCIWLSIELASSKHFSYIAFLNSGFIRIDGIYFKFNEEFALLIMRELPDYILRRIPDGDIWEKPAKKILEERSRSEQKK